MKNFLIVGLGLILILSVGLKAQNPENDPPTTIIKSVYFDGGSYLIDDEQMEEIRKLVESLPNPEEYQISITSHTDNIGGKAYNEWLSRMRSDAVLKELMQNNISEKNILSKDFGQENPLYDNRSVNGRIMNRRVDIIFLVRCYNISRLR
ncbi:MAG: OmpA family protein [Bacteroidia bacterium]|nr:OmpA family protein [Bacteroidia bacterium]